MRLQDLTAAQPAQFSDDGSQSQTFGFGMSDPKVIFTILRERMYSNPHKAAIQEYMCNARDAHREAGIDERPIEVTFPGFDGSEIYIRDFGYGIPKDKMEQVFCKYGASTKRTSDRFTGGWGLGCKTGFAVGDSFSVISITEDDDGIRRKRTYLAYLDDTAGGSMSVLNEEDTEEETGVQIQLPVDSSRLSEYAEYVAATGRFWKVKPNVKNCIYFEGWDEPDYYVRGDRWAMQKAGYYASSYIVLDGIQYRFRPEIFKGIEVSKTVEAMAKKPFVLFFETGELTPTPNREDLTYDEDSKFLIAQRLEEISSTFHESLRKQIDDLLNLNLHPLDLEQRYSENRSDLEQFAPDLCKEVSRFFLRDSIHAADNGLEVWKVQVSRSTWRVEDIISVPKQSHYLPLKKDKLYIFDDSGTKRPNRSRIYGMFHDIEEGNYTPDGVFGSIPFNEIVIVRVQSDSARVSLQKNHPHIYAMFCTKPLSEFRIKHIGGAPSVKKPKAVGNEVRALNRNLISQNGLYGAFQPFLLKLCKKKNGEFVPTTGTGYDEHASPNVGRTQLEDLTSGVYVVLKNGTAYSPENKSYVVTTPVKYRDKIVNRKTIEFPDSVKAQTNMISLVRHEIPILGVFEKGWAVIRDNPNFIPLHVYLERRLQRILQKARGFYQDGRFYVPAHYPSNLAKDIPHGEMVNLHAYLKTVNPAIVPWDSYRDVLKFLKTYPDARELASAALDIGKAIGHHLSIVNLEFTVPDDNRIKWFASALDHGKMTQGQKRQFLSLLRTTQMKTTA